MGRDVVIPSFLSAKTPKGSNDYRLLYGLVLTPKGCQRLMNYVIPSGFEIVVLNLESFHPFGII